MVGSTGKIIGIDDIKELLNYSVNNVGKDDPVLLFPGRLQLLVGGGRWSMLKKPLMVLFRKEPQTQLCPQALIDQLKPARRLILQVVCKWKPDIGVMWQATCWQCQNEISQCVMWTERWFSYIRISFFRLFAIIVCCKMLNNISLCYTVVQSLSCVWLFAASWTAAHQASLSFTISRSLQELTFIESVMPSSHLILCHPLLFCLQSFTASESFPMSWVFTSGGQSIGVSASATLLPVHFQDWFPLGLTGFLSPCSPRDSLKSLLQHHSSKHQFFSAQPSLWFSRTSILNYSKNHSFDCMDLCR